MRRGRHCTTLADGMGASVIISYDGTPNDHDALVLGRLLAPDVKRLALAYVRHAPEIDPQRETMAQHDAERKLEEGASLLGDPDLPRHVVFSASTGAGLQGLAETEGASLIAFGSDYRTPPGHADPPNSAQQLLEVGEMAVAIAAAGLRVEPPAQIKTIAVLPVDEDDAAQQTASGLAQLYGAEVVEAAPPVADLIVVGSPRGAPVGRLVISGAARGMLDASRGSVLVVPAGRPVALQAV